MTNYSLTEIETHCRKAARGAGYHWGEAEELGKAVRWLCANGINGAEQCLKLLKAVDGNCAGHRATLDTLQGAHQGVVCGLSLGCALADRGLDTLPEGLDIIAPMIAKGVMRADVGSAAPVTEISDAIWKALNGFAHRTYVPSTKESRMKGAG
jgi:hypothetical protein